MESNPTLAKKEFVNESYLNVNATFNSRDEVPPSSYEQELSRKLYHFMETSLNTGWQSWYFEQYHTINTLKKLDDKGMIKSLDLSSTPIQTLAPLRDFDKITTLRLNRNIISLGELSYFPHLKHLEIQNNSLRNLVGIHAMPNIEYLDISVNLIDDYKPLYELKHLKTLIINRAVHPNVIEALRVRIPGLSIHFI